MTDKVIMFPKPHDNPAALPDIPDDIESSVVLQKAIERDVTDVIVIGRTKEGFYFASAPSSKAEIIYLLERMKHMIMELP